MCVFLCSLFLPSSLSFSASLSPILLFSLSPFLPFSLSPFLSSSLPLFLSFFLSLFLSFSMSLSLFSFSHLLSISYLSLSLSLSLSFLSHTCFLFHISLPLSLSLSLSEYSTNWYKNSIKSRSEDKPFSLFCRRVGDEKSFKSSSPDFSVVVVVSSSNWETVRDVIKLFDQ